jgi:hypothetical protein
MRSAMLGALVGAVIVVACVGSWDSGQEAYADRPTTVYAAAGSDLIAVPAETDGGQVLTVIDTRQRVMSVYRIDGDTGKITLLSVRNIQWDLQLSEFNGEHPLPQEIRNMLEQR